MELFKYLIYSYYWCAQRTSAIFIQYSWSVFNVRIFSVAFLGNIFPKLPFFFPLSQFSSLPPLFPFVFPSRIQSLKIWDKPNTLQSPNQKFLQEKHVKDALLPISVFLGFFISPGGFLGGCGLQISEGRVGKVHRKFNFNFQIEIWAFAGSEGDEKWTFCCFSCLKCSWICVVLSWLEDFLP